MTVIANRASGAEQREDLITLTIDDIDVSVPKGTLVIRAAELIGVENDPSGVAREGRAGESVDLVNLNLARHRRQPKPIGAGRTRF